MKQETAFDTTQRPWVATYAQAGIVAELPAPSHASLAELVQERCTHFAAEQTAKRLKHPAFSCVMPNGMNGRLSFDQVNALSDAFAGYLRQTLKLQAGDRVAVQMPNCLAYPVVAFGVLKAGCVLVNTNPLYTESEMVHQFNDAGARVLVVMDMFADKLPGVLKRSRIEQVVVAQVSEFFPAVPNAVIRGVQKVWSKVLPPVTVPHVRLALALAQGRTTLAATPAKTYWQGLTHTDLAALQYTGGTTGVSKGAVLLHRNLVANVLQSEAWNLPAAPPA